MTTNRIHEYAAARLIDCADCDAKAGDRCAPSWVPCDGRLDAIRTPRRALVIDRLVNFRAAA